MSGQDEAAAIAPPSTAFWADPRLRGIVFQAIALGLVVWLFWTMASNAADALKRSGQATGWSFLWNTAGFDIGFKLIPYTARDRQSTCSWSGCSLPEAAVPSIAITGTALIG